MTLRDVIEDRWRALDSGRSNADFRTTALPEVTTPSGPLLLAVGTDRSRHLLVPLAARQTVAVDRRGRAVHLLVRPLEDEREYRRYADLALVDPALAEVFTSLCEDVLLAVGRTPDRPVRALRAVLEAWRRLLAGAGGVLPDEALAGLFGELTVLERLAAVDSGIAHHWHGPTGSAQDFHDGVRAIEVKATTRPEGRTIRVHGIDQLDRLPGGSLTLVWFRLARDASSGISVPELVDRVSRLLDDPAPLRTGLATLGYREIDRRHYIDIRFTILEEIDHRVGPGFPRIVPGGLIGDALGAGVADIVYTVDLDSGPARAARIPDFVAEFLAVAP